ncbi:MAG TPA: recombinase family protein [Gemmataceae bacterium]
MSSDKQNPRSPDQQFDTIEEFRKRAGYPWAHVGSYRDDAISGRYVKRRPQLQQMLRDIEVGLVKADLIVVDTLERLGRAEEIAELRRKLLLNHGVLVVAADNRFADPTGFTGKAIALIENIRATEDGRVKAHNVIRGKKDAVRLKKWPGGPAPMGFRLRPVVTATDKGPKLEHVLDVVPAHVAAVQMAFRRAADTGHGPGRLAAWWNSNPEIPDDLKPMYESTMRYIFKNEIYIGRYVWGKNCTDVVDDTRKTELNPDGPHATVDDYCEATVDPQLFKRVQVLAAIRAKEYKQRRANKEKNDPEKLIAPQVAGISLTYLLVGLVRCGKCHSSMRPIASGRRSKAGKKYVYFTCPRKQAGACTNTYHVPEDKLRAAVIGRLRARLFPPPDQSGQRPDWLPEVVAAVEQEIARHRACQPDRAAAQEAELCQLDDQLRGWMMSLGDPDLPGAVRTDIVSRYDAAKARRAELDAQVRADRVMSEQINRAVDPAAVLDCLRHLDDVLAAHNPTLGNLELSKHIDRILCFPDGRVEMRGTWLGVLGDAVDFLHRGEPSNPADPPAERDFNVVKPRKRGRLRLPNLSADSADVADVDAWLDPDRFAGLPDVFFWTETPVVGHSQGWAADHAAEVAAARRQGLTHEQLVERFHVTPPTIRKALKIAAEADPTLADVPRKMRRARWQDSHYEEVNHLYKEGMTQKQLTAHFGKSEPIIRLALRLAAENGLATDQPSVFSP